MIRRKVTGARWIWVLCGAAILGLGLGTRVGWAAPGKEERLKEAEELKDRYEKLYGEGKYAEAEPLAKRACSILEKERGEGSEEFAVCLTDLGLLYYKQGNYGKAKPLLERALAIKEKVLEPDHLEVATSLNNLASLYRAQGAHDKAEPLYERALAIREKVLGRDHPKVATSLNNLASLYRAQGAYDKAELLYERALAISERALGPDHPDVVTGLSSLGSLYQDQGAYSKAELLLERALAIQEKVSGPDHPRVAASLNNLATLYLNRGAYGKAEPLFERALAIGEKMLGADHPHVAASLNNLAGLYLHQGKYDKAEPLFERALTIREKALGPDHPDVATSLNNLATMYQDQGAYSKAEPLHERALAVREKALGPEHRYVSMSLSNLAMLYQSQGAYSKAEPLHERALAVREKALGPEHPDIARSLNNLASLYQAQGAYGRADPLFERALAINEKALGPEHPDVATSLNNLAMQHWAQEAYDKAESLHERALAIREKALGPDHTEIAVSLENLAECHHDQGAHGSGLTMQRRAFRIQETSFVRNLVIADESRRLAYAALLSSSLHSVLSLHHRIATNDAIAELALTTLLRRKNRVQDLVAQSTAALRLSLPEDDRHLLDDLSDVDSLIAVLSSRGPGKLPVDEFRKQLDGLGKGRDQLWSELAKHSSLIESLDHRVTMKNVQQGLPRDGVLIELIEYAPIHGDDGKHLRWHETKPPPRYAAYLVYPDRFDWVDLGEAEPIEQHVVAFRKALAGKTAIPTGLHETVMRPILERLPEGTNRLIIAPDGDLNLVPFGAIYDGKQYLIEKYALRYVSTGRDLLERPGEAVTTTPMVVVANPTGARLPATEREADFLADLFPDARILEGERATETNLRAIERPLILHMATHGFFGKAKHLMDNPMLRSGLELAHLEKAKPVAPVENAEPAANAGLPEPPARSDIDPELDDGQLTAYEVSGWDLRGTQLVVLSACETGLGKVEMGEGVLGLRRAFAMAGAQTQVMSLWRVGDLSAKELMAAYYLELAKGKGRGEAMQEVQLQMLRSEDRRHPHDWAAFVVTGDDEPMRFPVGEEPVIPEVEGPPTVDHRRRGGCNAGGNDRDQPLGSLLLGLLGLALRRRRL